MLEKAILTGFEPFGSNKYNPTGDIALRLNRQNLGDLEIIGLKLPIDYYEASEILIREIEEQNPCVVLSTGLFSRIPKIRFEAVGHNRMESKYPDIKGRMPEGEEIIKGDKSFYRTNIDNVALASSLDISGIPAEVSVNAEYFVCNSLIYLVAREVERENLQVKFGFLHTPWTGDYKGLVDITPEKIIIRQEDFEQAIKTTLIKMREISSFKTV